MITDYMGADAEYEREQLAAADIAVVVAADRDQSNWLPRARTADAIITRHARLDATAIEQLERCRVIARYGAGVDNVDVGAAHERGIVVTYVPGGSTDEVADHAMGLIVMVARGMLRMSLSIRSGGWIPSAPLPRILRGLRLGLVGGGRIGQAVALRAAAFGMRPMVVDPTADHPSWAAQVSELDEMLPMSDVLSLHAPLTPETHDLIGERELTLLPPDAIVINTARGGLLNTDAVLAALESGHLGGAGLDVFPEEPLPTDHPLRYCDGAVLTPHLAYCSAESVNRAKHSVVHEVCSVLSDDLPRNPWEPED